jgi:HEAT repeat protein
MDPASIIAALEAPTDDRSQVMYELEETAPADQLATALRMAGAPLTRQLLVDLLGFQAAPAGVPALIAALQDREQKVRSSAADALGKVFLTHPDDPQRAAAGDALLERWQDEPAVTVRQMIAAALGATRNRAAVPALEAALQDPDDGVRAMARWALDQFRAR